MSKKICYLDRRKYKYELSDHEVHRATPLTRKDAIATEYVELDESGNLTIRIGYAWDGPSFPLANPTGYMRASLIHDALYQLMRMKRLEPTREHRKVADEEFRKVLREDGAVGPVRRVGGWALIRMFGKRRLDPKHGPRRIEVCAERGKQVSVVVGGSDG